MPLYFAGGESSRARGSREKGGRRRRRRRRLYLKLEGFLRLEGGGERKKANPIMAGSLRRKDSFGLLAGYGKEAALSARH